jgi:hypothetical protein
MFKVESFASEEEKEKDLTQKGRGGGAEGQTGGRRKR